MRLGELLDFVSVLVQTVQQGLGRGACFRQCVYPVVLEELDDLSVELGGSLISILEVVQELARQFGMELAQELDEAV